MSNPTNSPLNPTLPPDPQESRPASISPEVWAQIQAETEEMKAQNFQNREQVLAWLEARGCEDGEKILERLRAGGDI